MGFLSYMKGLIARLFAVKDIKTALGIDVPVTQNMIDKIDNWQSMYAGKAQWTDDFVKSLRLEKSITREFVNVALNEMTVNVSNEKLDAIFQNAIRDLNMHLQRGLATGAMVIKPIGEDKVQYIPQGAYIPVEYDVKGRLIKVIFPEFKQLGENSYYTRLEFHSLDYVSGITITNKAYYSASENYLGREIPLESIEEWARLPQVVRYPDMTRPAYGYYRNPIDNDVDDGHCGISIYDGAVDMIKKADVQFGRLDWEFESGERAVYVDSAALAPVQTRDGKSFVNPKLNKRLFKGLNMAGAGGDDLYKEYSPDFRQEDIVSGLNEYKRVIEFQVGLSYGDISDPESVDKTATEVITAKKRKYNTVTAIQNNLKVCLDDLAYALAFFNRLTSTKYEFICDFKDSILTDEDTERQRDIQDLNLGILRPEEYRAKWHGESLEEALKNLPQQTEVVE